ncbi:P-loop containing nucleoside triphosphate hydrolase protein [Mycena olivaceomarginata]|nr:P-loop containing nucleoside triphosphate hydrolase protein [Mycena olivaceomarginata]
MSPQKPGHPCSPEDLLCHHLHFWHRLYARVCWKERRHDWILLIAGVATAITFAVASISEHYHSIGPSTLTSLYAIIGTIFYAYPLRGLHEIRALPIYLYGDAAAAVSLFVLVFLESKSKRSLLILMYPPPAYESTLSFLVKPFFPHIVPLLSTGYRRISLPELHGIPLYLRSDPRWRSFSLLSRLRTRLAAGISSRAPFRAFGGHFLGPILPRLLVLTGTFAQVTLVEQMLLVLAYILQPQNTRFLSEFCKVNAFVVLYRSALTGSLYAKTLRLTSMAARELGQGAATTYMSVDVQKVTNGFSTFQELWAAVIIACTMLWYKAGYVMFAPLLFIVTIIASTTASSSTSVLGQLLPIKLGAYEAPLEGKINALRKLETDALGGFIYYMAVAATLSGVGGSASFLVTLAAYAVMLAKGWGNLPPLDVSQIFTLFTIVNLLNDASRIVCVVRLSRAHPRLLAASDSDEGVMEAGLVDVSVDGVKESTVSLKGCTFAWDDNTNVLKDITLELAPRELHMVVGSVASGKSSLLMSILEETRLVEGKIKVKAHKASSVALASQTPFIFPETLRGNILLDSAYDEDFYHEVIHACGLRQDIETLPRRDMTRLGDKGTTLSGGQRQRLASPAIARAVYARADLILPDDVFSALDGETEAHVFASLFGPDGMLKGKTTVLVTHGIHHLPSADKVIVMEAGTITHFGSFEELVSMAER